jgi:hypothetical protein
MSGPPPTPTELRLLRGNPGKRAVNKREPKPELDNGALPAKLTSQDLAEARALWEEMAPRFVATKLLSQIDRKVLERACRLEVLGDRLLAESEKTPMRDTPNNGLQLAPELTGALRCYDAADRIWFRFGVTPSERSRIRVGEETPKSKWAGLVKGSQ